MPIYENTDGKFAGGQMTTSSTNNVFGIKDASFRMDMISYIDRYLVELLILGWVITTVSLFVLFCCLSIKISRLIGRKKKIEVGFRRGKKYYFDEGLDDWLGKPCESDGEDLCKEREPPPPPFPIPKPEVIITLHPEPTTHSYPPPPPPLPQTLISNSFNTSSTISPAALQSIKLKTFRQ